MAQKTFIIILLTFSVVLFGGCGNKAIKNAKKLIGLGSFKEATELLTEESKKNPTNPDIFYYIGIASLKAYLQGKSETDISFVKDSFDKAIKLDAGYKNKIAKYLHDVSLKIPVTYESFDKEATPTTLTKKDDSPKCVYYVANMAFAYNEKFDDEEDFFYCRQMINGYSNDIGETFIKKFPNSVRLPEVFSVVARQYYNQESNHNSKRIYQELVKRFPDTDQGKDAKDKLANWMVKSSETLRPAAGIHMGYVKKGSDFVVNAQGIFYNCRKNGLRRTYPDGINVPGVRGGWFASAVDDYGMLMGAIIESSFSWDEVHANEFKIGARKKIRANKSGRLYVFSNKVYTDDECEGTYSITFEKPE